MTAEIVLTLDVDWAPDHVIDFTASILVEQRARATWFLTHDSPAVRRLADHADLFEFGIHPNFLPGSTHGCEPAEVLEHCMRLVPTAVSMRTHGLMQWTSLFDLVLDATPVRTDVSLLLPWADGVAPVRLPRPLGEVVRVPYVFEDDIEMDATEPCWSLDELLRGDGLKVVDIHPIHVALNSRTFGPYRLLKELGPLTEAGAADVESVANPGEGARTLLKSIAAHLGSLGGGRTIREVAGDVDG